jgi:hypothetical protein
MGAGQSVRTLIKKQNNKRRPFRGKANENKTTYFNGRDYRANKQRDP